MGSKLHGYTRYTPVISIDPLSNDACPQSELLSSEYFVCDRRSIFHEAPHARTRKRAGNLDAHDARRTHRRPGPLAARTDQLYRSDDMNTEHSSPRQLAADHLEYEPQLVSSSTNVNESIFVMQDNIKDLIKLCMRHTLIFLYFGLGKIFTALRDVYRMHFNPLPKPTSFYSSVWCAAYFLYQLTWNFIYYTGYSVTHIIYGVDDTKKGYKHMVLGITCIARGIWQIVVSIAVLCIVVYLTYQWSAYIYTVFICMIFIGSWTCICYIVSNICLNIREIYTDCCKNN